MSKTLVSVLNDDATRRAVISDAVTLIETEVASKSGLRGAAIRAGFKTIKKIKPGIMSAAVDKLLPAFAPALDPFYARAKQQGSVHTFFTVHADEIADALLTITDEKAKGAKNAIMKKVYGGLRGQAKVHTSAAMPGVADLISKHVG